VTVVETTLSFDFAFDVLADDDVSAAVGAIIGDAVVAAAESLASSVSVVLTAVARRRRSLLANSTAFYATATSMSFTADVAQVTAELEEAVATGALEMVLKGCAAAAANTPLNDWAAAGVPACTVDDSLDLLAAMTRIPSERTPEPMPLPTHAIGECADSATWHKVGKPAKGCGWVAKDTARRCDRAGDDATTAMASCPATCDSCGHDDCGDSATWHKAGKPKKDCDWAAKDMKKRCSRVGDDGTTAAASCKATCRSCATCTDVWTKKGKTYKGCAWVTKKKKKRCSLEGSDGTLASDACCEC